MPDKVSIDDQGNVWVASDDGKHLTMAAQDHCLEVMEAEDHQSMGCLVSRGLDDHGFVPQLQVEIYRVGGRLLLEPGGAIREWHFWNNGRQVAVLFQINSGQGAEALYDAKTGELVERLLEPADLTQLPQWGKTRGQIDDESVPMNPALSEERNKWIAKVMRAIGTIKPGMLRQDLTLFHEDGGLTSFGSPQRFVFKECPLIKIDVRFKLTRDEQMANNPNDVIESVSKPYFEYPFAD